MYGKVGIRKKENAYLTVYLSLVFGIILSLLLALIEGAAIWEWIPYLRSTIGNC